MFPCGVGESDLFACRVDLDLLSRQNINLDFFSEQIHQHLFQIYPLLLVISSYHLKLLGSILHQVSQFLNLLAFLYVLDDVSVQSLKDIQVDSSCLILAYLLHLIVPCFTQVYFLIDLQWHLGVEHFSASRTIYSNRLLVLLYIFLDALCSLSIVESCDGFVESERIGTDACDHDGPGCASKWIFKQSGEFAISVGNMVDSWFFIVFDQSINAITQR